jgi:glycosyltransferase involved in cell wall biosynthesis
MINVGFSSDIFETQRHGGVSRYFVELAKNFKSLKEIDIKIATAIHINSNLKNSKLNSGLYLPFSPSRLKLESFIRFSNNNQSKLISSKIPLDIKHETFYRGGIDNLTAKKTITTVYDLTREKFSPNWHGFKRKQDSLTRADAIICISRSTENDLQNFYQVDPSKIIVIPLGVGRIFESNAKPDLMKQQLLYVGARDGYKDFRTLIVAFSNSKYLRSNFKVLVFGNRFSREEELFMQSAGVRNYFRQITGNDKRLVAAYNNSIALVITSRYEGFSLPVLEAMMAGVLVITSRGGALKEVAGGYDIPFEQSDPNSLTEAIITCVNLISFDKKHKENARNYARSFTWDLTAQRTIQVYKSILGIKLEKHQ